jgi:hypothetical protein
MLKLIPAVLFAALLACSGKPTWTEYKSGPVTVQFPCSPKTSSAVTKCLRSDGTEYSLAVVEKNISDEEELAQSKQYAENIPYGEVLKMDAFPLHWREGRRQVKADCMLWYKGGKEYVVTAAYTSDKPPDILQEFFAKVKVE